MINKIKINNKTREVKKYNNILGILGENKFETLKFTFDEFIDGIGTLVLEKLDTEGNLKKYFIELEKGEECYLLEVKNSLLDVAGEITMQLIVRKEDYVVFKSLDFQMTVLNAIKATEEIPDEYETWDAILAEKILEINKKIEDLSKLESTLNTLLNDANLKKENIEELQGKLQFLISQTPHSTISGESINVQDANAWNENKLAVMGNLKETLADSTQEKSTTNPATINTATGVQRIKKYKKNKLKLPDTEIEFAGVTIKIQDNKLILNGTATSGGFKVITNEIKTLLKGTYTFSQAILSGTFNTGAYRLCLKNESVTDAVKSPLTFTSGVGFATNTVDTNITELGIYINKGNVYDNYTIGLQVEEGSLTEFEPCTEEIYELDLGETELCKLAEDSIDKAVYKDNKWQWQKVIKKIESYNEETISTDYISSTGELSTGATVYYKLDTPEYIDCTEEQSAVLDKLYNNLELSKGANYIEVESDNGVGVELELTYMQNIQLKYDNEIAEIKQTLLELQGGN